jgi:hypothetical protein
VGPEADVTRPGLRTLWFGLLAGPLAWFALLQTGYAMVPWVCDQGHPGLLHALALGALAVALAGSVVGWRASRGAAPGVDASPPPGRRRFMAVTGALLSGTFGLVILATTLAALVRTCA